MGAGALARRRRVARIVAVPIAGLAAIGALVAVRVGRSTGVQAAPPAVAVVDGPVDDNRIDVPGSWQEVPYPSTGDGPRPRAITAARAEPGDANVVRVWFEGGLGDSNAAELSVCHHGYRILVEEGAHAVTLTPVRYERRRATGQESPSCVRALVPETRSLRVRLAAPLGDRTVIDGRAKAPVPAVAEVPPSTTADPPVVVSVPVTNPPSAQPPLTTFPTPATTAGG